MSDKAEELLRRAVKYVSRPSSLAKDIDDYFAPPAPPQVDGWELTGEYRAPKEGDYYLMDPPTLKVSRAGCDWQQIPPNERWIMRKAAPPREPDGRRRADWREKTMQGMVISAGPHLGVDRRVKTESRRQNHEKRARVTEQMPCHPEWAKAAFLRGVRMDGKEANA